MVKGRFYFEIARHSLAVVIQIAQAVEGLRENERKSRFTGGFKGMIFIVKLRGTASPF